MSGGRDGEIERREEGQGGEEEGEMGRRRGERERRRGR